MPDPRRELAKAQPGFVPDFYKRRSKAIECIAPVSPLLGRGHFFSLLIGLVIGLGIGYAYAHGQALNCEARAERDNTYYGVNR